METLPEVPGGTAGAAMSTWRLVSDPAGLMRDMSARHGRTFRMALLNGPSVVTGDPALVAALFGDPELFDAPNEISGPLVGERSIVLAEGARHKRKRKLMAPPFHGARMRTYGRIIAEAARRHTHPLVPGSQVAVLDVTQRISLEVIIRAVFGVRDPERVEAFRAVIARTVELLPAWLLFLPILHHDLGGLGPWARYQETVRALIALLRLEIARGRAEEGRQDILALLLSARDEAGEPMPEDEIVDELRTLVIAGHETTATTMGWALWQLHRNPRVLARLHDELATLGPEPDPDALVKLPYLAAVCDETMRLHPIAPVFRRRLLEDAELAGRRYPAGTVFHPSPLLTHFDPAIYPDPTLFRPERFLERKYTPYELYPFGGGNRRCVGAAFAAYEMQIALGTILAHHRFQLVSEAPIRLALNGVTTRPVGGIHLRYLGPTERAGGA